MMNEDVFREFQDTEKELIDTVSSFTPEEFNIIPFEGSWTAGQVTRHILLSASSAHVLREPVKKTSRRPDEHIAKLRSIFLDFGTKMNSPEFIIPGQKDYDQNELLDAFRSIAAELKEIIQTLDLSEICLNAPPVLGELTRLELIRFISFHTQRHIYQLKNIKQALRIKQGST